MTDKKADAVKDDWQPISKEVFDRLSDSLPDTITDANGEGHSPLKRKAGKCFVNARFVGSCAPWNAKPMKGKPRVRVKVGPAV